MKFQTSLLSCLAILLLIGCAAPTPVDELPAELPTAAILVSTPIEIQPEVLELGEDCGQAFTLEECANSGDHTYLQFVEAENTCNDDGDDEIVQFSINFSAGEVSVFDVSNGETRTYLNFSPNLYRNERTFENGWIDVYVIEFTPAGFTEVYEYTDPAQGGANFSCLRITRTLDDGL